MSIDAQAALASANSALVTVAAAVAEKDASLSALSLQVDSLSAANVGLQAQLDTANQTIAGLKAKIDELQPKPPEPKTTVKHYDAKGDGLADDTAAFQQAVDDLTARGLPVIVPTGNYLLDPVKSVFLRTGTKMELAPDAVLVAKPNAAEKTNVLWAKGVTDVSIVGGKIVGDREQHDYSAGGTHEWGDGIRFTGVKRASVKGMHISKCAGDGITLNGEDITLEGVTSTQNRRQALTIGGVKRVKIINCQLLDTGELAGQAGASPKAGIDAEPDVSGIDDLLVEGCTLKGNDSAGFLAWIRSEVRVNLTNIVLRNNRIEGNVNGAWTKGLGGTVQITYDGNTFGPGRGNAIKVDQNTKAILTNNTFIGWTSTNAVARLNGGTFTATGSVYK